jgi:glycosyltransferase involved in cell wall biosynthesis
MFPKVAIRRSATLENLSRFRCILKDLAPDVLVTHNWGSIEWAMANQLVLGRHRVRHVHIEDGFGPEEVEGQIRRRVLIRRFVLRRSTVVLPSLTLQTLAAKVWRLPAPRLRHIPNGLDLDRFQPTIERSPLSVPGTGPVVGTVAALRPEKNLARLLRAAGLLRDEGLALRLAIVGEGPERPGLEALAAELGLADRMLFTGGMADPSVAYRGFDVFALSSDTEQMPLSVLEAMATGLPVAATRVGDVPQMLASANQPFLSACDPSGLAAALRPLLQNAVLRRRVGEENRAKAERDYDQQIMFRCYGALLDHP